MVYLKLQNIKYIKLILKGYTNKTSYNGVYSIDDPYLYNHFKVTGKRESNIDLLTRKKKPENIAIYGN